MASVNCEHLFYGKTMRCVHCNQPFTGAPSEPTPIDLAHESPLLRNTNDPREDLRRPENGGKPSDPVEQFQWDGRMRRIE